MNDEIEAAAEPRGSNAAPSAPSEPAGNGPIPEKTGEAGIPSRSEGEGEPGSAAGAPKPRSRSRGRRGGRGRSRPKPEGSQEPATTTATDAEPGKDGSTTRTIEPGAETGDERAAEGSEERSSGQRRRRRRGGRGRGGSKPSADQGSGDGALEARTKSPASEPSSAGADAQTEGSLTQAAEPVAGPDGDGTPARPRSRSRRRRRKPASSSGATEGAEEQPSLDDPPAAIVADEEQASSRRSRSKSTDGAGARGRGAKSGARSGDKSGAKSGGKSGAKSGARETDRSPARSRAKSSVKSAAKSKADSVKDEAATVAGPTRLRRGRAAPTRTRARSRRRREPVIIPPRITDKLMVITEHGERDQIAVLEDRDLVQHYVTRAGATSMVGNVYLGRVQNVLPGMEAAFVDVGRGRNAVLYAGEVNYSAEDLEGDTPPRIQDVLKSGQSVPVQVTKDPMGGKGARLTAQISVPGRFLVLMPNSNVFGISRRISEEERKRQKAIAKKIRPDGVGLIIRTAAEGASEEELAADLGRVVEVWKDIEKRAKKAKAPAILYEEPELTVRVVRDLFTDEEYKELVTDSPRIYEKVTQYLNEVAPDLARMVHLHEGKLSAFEEHHIVEQIHKALDRKVWLPSGGYLIIERTEAMTVIDVNTGKSVGKTNLEETVVNTNIEAAAEAARQLRLRDIGGIIIIDFIDMLLEKNKEKVTDTLRETMALDKTRSQVFEIGPLGLLEVTRKRVSGGLVESFSETCPTCEGRGILVNYDA